MVFGNIDQTIEDSPGASEMQSLVVDVASDEVVVGPLLVRAAVVPLEYPVGTQPLQTEPDEVVVGPLLVGAAVVPLE